MGPIESPEIKREPLVSLENDHVKVYSHTDLQKKVVIYSEIIALKHKDDFLYVNNEVIPKNRSKIAEKEIEAYNNRIKKDKLERESNRMEKENNVSVREVDLLINLPEANVKEYHREDGGVFYKVKLPNDFVIDGLDLSRYQFACGKIYRNGDGKVSVPMEMNKEVVLKKFKMEADRTYTEMRPQTIPAKALAAAIAKRDNSQVCVLAKVSEAYVRRDIARKDGNGTFCEVTVPRGTVINGKDCSLYRFAVRSAYRNEANYASIPLPLNKEITIKNRKKGEDGTFSEIDSIKINSKDLIVAMENSYAAYKAAAANKEAEKDNPFVENGNTVAEPGKANSEKEQNGIAEPEKKNTKERERTKSR